MSLAPREQQALARIEDSFRSTDPSLATMLADFTVATSRRSTLRLAHRPSRRRISHLIQVTAAVALIALSVVLFSTLSHTPHVPATRTATCGTTVIRAAGCPSGTGASRTGQENSSNAEPLPVAGK
jgi:hypothetical protein